MDRLKGKVAIITGGNSGVGEATAKMFAKEGATVVITARREAALEKVAEEIKAAGGEVFAVSTDISKKGDPERLRSCLVLQFVARHLFPLLNVNSGGTFRYVPPLFSHICLPAPLFDAYFC